MARRTPVHVRVPIAPEDGRHREPAEALARSARRPAGVLGRVHHVPGRRRQLGGAHVGMGEPGTAGLLYVGGGQRGAFETRAFIQVSGNFYLVTAAQKP
jgi:hypothetical protein